MSLSSPPVRGLSQVQSTRHNFCGNPRSHFLTAEVFKREGTFAQSLFLKKNSVQLEGAQGAMAALAARCPASPPATGALPAPFPVPAPPIPPPAPLQPGLRRRHKSGAQAGAGEMVLANPGLMFQLLWWREQIAPQKLLSHGLGCLPQ